MRYHYQAEPDLQITPIEKIRLPLRSRDELPPILAGLQWLWMHPTLRAEILALLEAAVLAGKQATGRTGMDLWQILVLGVVRLGLDADWDRLEHIANYDSLVRQMLGVPATPWGEEAKVFAIKPCGTTSPCWMTHCSTRSTRASPPPDARCSQKRRRASRGA